MKHLLIIFCALFLFLNKAFADNIKFKQLEIKDAWIKETLPNHSVTGGYVKIQNHGNSKDVLLSVSADFAMSSEIHEMKMDGDVMKMRALKKGLIIPAK